MRHKFKVGQYVMLFAKVEAVRKGGDLELMTDSGNHIAESARNVFKPEPRACAERKEASRE